jgi:hypothetical protein
VPTPTTTSNTSLALPVFVRVFVNETFAPCAADATVWPVNVSEADALTVNGAALVVNGPTFDTPSL